MRQSGPGRGGHPHPPGADGRVSGQVRLHGRGRDHGAPPVDGRLPGGRSQGLRRHLHRQPHRRLLQGHQGHRQEPPRGRGHPHHGGQRPGPALHQAGGEHDGGPDLPGRPAAPGGGDHPPGDPVHRGQVLRAGPGGHRHGRVPCRGGRRAGHPLRPLPLQRGPDAALPGQQRRGAHPQPRQPAPHPGAEGLPRRQDRRAGQGGEPEGLLPDGHRRRVLHRQGPSGGPSPVLRRTGKHSFSL